MSTPTPSQAPKLPPGIPGAPPPWLLATLASAARLRGEGRIAEAAAAVEAKLAEVRAAPLDVPFMARVQLGLALADLHLAGGDLDRARRLLAEEAAHADRIVQVLRETGTPEQARAAAAGRFQLRDRATQVALLGSPAPALDVADWVLGEPTTLDRERGRVVLLEFWATWCRPCLEMFPRLRDLHARHAGEGLTILALTHYAALPPDKAGATDAAALRAHERETVLQVVRDRALPFAVGIAPDERLQRTYGAAGIPTLVLIDRAGIVRYASSSPDQRALDAALAAALADPSQTTGR